MKLPLDRHTTFDGTRWGSHTPLPEHETSRGPALAVFGGKLHLVHRGGNDNYLCHATYNGTSWTRDTRPGGHETASNPALAVYDNKLHLVHCGDKDDSLWHVIYDGSWGPDRKFSGHFSLEGPALAVFRGELYCIHRGYGSGDQNLWWTKFRTGGVWTADQKFPGHLSGAGPAAAYRDANAEHDQLVVVHRGWGKKAAGTDTAEDEARLTAMASPPPASITARSVAISPGSCPVPRGRSGPRAVEYAEVSPVASVRSASQPAPA